MKSPCPNRTELSSWAAGRTTDNADERFAEHVAECPSCAALLSELAGSDSLRACLRSGGEDERTAGGQLFERVRERFPTLDARDPTASTSRDVSALDRATLAPGEFMGTELDERRYRIERILGRGGMGVVYAAQDERLQRRVALKVVRADRATGDGLLRFEREARAAARLNHEHLVAVHGLERLSDGTPLLVMEFVEGTNAAERLAISGPFAATEAARLVEQGARGAQAAHAGGVLHRDIKPANLLIENATGRAKLADFGLAALAESTADERLTRGGQLIGTPAYLSPEGARGDVPLDARHDVYGLGATLYELLTGEPPFRGAPEAIVRQDRTDLTRETLLSTLPYLRHCVQSQASHPPYRLAYADSLLNLGRLAAAAEDWSEAAIRFAECAPLLGERPADQFVAAEGLANALERLGPVADNSDELRLRNAWGEQLRAALSSLARHSEFGPRIERDSRWKPWR